MKKILKIIGVLIVGFIAVTALAGGGSDSKSSSNSKPKWNMNFDDQMATVENMKICIDIMKKMDNVAAHAKKVSPSDVFNNMDKYMGQVLEFGATITEVEDAPPKSGAAKAFGGSAHVVVAKTDDGVTVMATKKGDSASANSNVGSFTVIVGMPVCLQELPGVGEKILVIAGNPK